jgi:hypothetical protein
MSPTTNLAKPSPNGETILLYLADSREDVHRTKTAIKQGCGLTGTPLEAALADLQELGLIERRSDRFVLSEAGRVYVQRKREKKVGGNTYNINSQTNVDQRVGKAVNSTVAQSTVKNAAAKTANGKADALTATPISFNSLYNMSANGELGIDKTLRTGTLPYLTAQAHPTRANSAPPRHYEGNRGTVEVSVRFLLAISSLSDALPIPVFDQDKLGRSPKNQISLAHDVYLSQTHCQFQIKRNKTTNAWELYIEDLDSSNGTVVNGTQIDAHKPVLLKHGSKLTLGSLTFVVVEVPLGN